MEKWYEVAVSYKDDHGTETIATFDTLKEAKQYADKPQQIKKEIWSKEIQPYSIWEEVDFIFIDKWYAEDGGSAWREDNFDAIIYKENK